MKAKWFTIFSLLLVLAVAFSAVAPAAAADDPIVPVPDVSDLGLPGGEVQVDPELQIAAGRIQIVVRLVDAPLARAVGANAKQRGSSLNPSQQRGYVQALNQKQNALLAQIAALGGIELGRVSKALNAVIVEVDASQIEAIAGLPNVASIRPLVDYEVDLSETVPYIGAAAVQTAGIDGTGVRVAVLDSGIDYTHYNLGGSGVVADFTANDPTLIEAGTFPTSKVVGGFDFVGEVWTGAAGSPALAPDPDPLDKGTGAGHGTHVGDIIAGKSNDSVHKGVAPGASLYAVGVCSKVTTACSGIALLLGMDFALDPDGNNDITDAVDVINMSLGSNYGQREDDLSFASANAVRFGVVVVASAGNAADRPYIVGSPSSAPEVISVAQTQVPSAISFPLVVNSPANIAGIYPNTATLAWAPIGAGFTGDVAFVGRGCLTGAGVPAGGDPYLADPSGKVALIDRGTCNISEKVRRASDAGAIGVLIGLVAGGDAVSFSNGGDCPEPADGTCKPSLVIIQSYANMIKANINAPVNVSVSPANVTSLVGSMAGSSSRGPSHSFNAIKPDIGAPGASLSAETGTGTGQTAFSGTSGAAPMVSGSAALVIAQFPGITPPEVKARLMNTGETQIYINPATQPGVLAPITRIGGGEVRVDRAIATTTAAWDADDLTGSLSFGYHALTGSSTFQKNIVVRNYSNTARTYTITPNFRYAGDAASGAVTIDAPGTVRVRANSTATFRVRAHVDVTRLPLWTLNGGSRGGDGFRLQEFEFDGYLDISDATDSVHVAWQILPHRSAEVTTASDNVTLVDGLGSLELSNAGGAVDGRVDVFSLLGTSGRIPPPLLPSDGDNYAIIDLKSVGARLVSIGGGQFGIQFAIDTFSTRAHPNYPAEFDIFIDANRDGTDDFVIFNLENGGFGVSGQSVVAAGPLPNGPFSAFFFTDADLNSGSVIMTVPLAAIGLTPGTQFDFSAFGCDNYFTGFCTDAITGMTYTAGAPRYFGSGVPAAGVPAGGSSTLAIQAVPGGDVASPSQIGLLLMYRDARQQREADAVTIAP